MFIYQAQKSFEKWHKILPEVNDKDVMDLLLMIRIGILGDIGSGKSLCSEKFWLPCV